MQFLLRGYDDTGPNTAERRASARPGHMDGVKALIEGRHLVFGGRLLKDDRVIGSLMLLEFNSRAEFDAWLAREPYVMAKVWTTVEVEVIQLTQTPRQA